MRILTAYIRHGHGSADLTKITKAELKIKNRGPVPGPEKIEATLVYSGMIWYASVRPKVEPKVDLRKRFSVCVDPSASISKTVLLRRV